MKPITWTTARNTREVPFSVLRALVLLGGRATVHRLAGIMALTGAEVEARLATWRQYGAVAKEGDRWRLLPEQPDPPYPRRSRRYRESPSFHRDERDRRSNR